MKALFRYSREDMHDYNFDRDDSGPGAFTSTSNLPGQYQHMPKNLAERQRLTTVDTLIQCPQRFRHLRDSSPYHGLLALDLTLSKPLCELLSRLRVLLLVVEDDKSLHPDPHADDHEVVLGSLWSCQYQSY